jgi:hypothetical protein
MYPFERRGLDLHVEHHQSVGAAFERRDQPGAGPLMRLMHQIGIAGRSIAKVDGEAVGEAPRERFGADITAPRVLRTRKGRCNSLFLRMILSENRFRFSGSCAGAELDLGHAVDHRPQRFEVGMDRGALGVRNIVAESNEKHSA